MRPIFNPGVLTEDSLGFSSDIDPGGSGLGWARVSHRAAGVSPVFIDQERFSIFTEALQQSSESSGMEVHAYSVVPRRYHLLVKGTPDAIDSGVRDLVSVFTQWINLDNPRPAPLLQARSTRTSIGDNQLSGTLTDIHFAPVDEGHVPTPTQTCWSSYRCYIGSQPPPKWLKVDRILSHIGGPVAHRDSVTDRIIYNENANQPEHAVPLEEIPQRPFKDE